MNTTLLVLALGTTLSAQSEPVTVYIVEPTAQFVDTELQQRIDTTKDLKTIKWDKKLVRLVDAPEQATIVLEVLGRGVEAQNNSHHERSVITGQIQDKSYQDKVVRVKMTVGDYSTEIIGRSIQRDELSVTSWKSAAIRASNEVEKWVKTNREKLNR